MRVRPLCRVAAAYLCGLFFACTKWPWRLAPILLFVLLTGTQAVSRQRRKGAASSGTAPPRIALRLRWKTAAALFAAALTGACVMYTASAPPQALSAEDQAGGSIVVTGTITDYEIKNDQIYYTIQLENRYHQAVAMTPVQDTKDTSVSSAETKNIPLTPLQNTQTATSYQAPGIGMRVQAVGELRFFEAPTNPSQFDLQLYYKGKNVDFAVKNAELTVLDAHYAHVRTALRRLQLRLASVLEQMAGEEDAGVLSAMLFGEKNGLDEEIQGLYRRNGIAHVLAVSGLHVSLIGMGLYLLLRRCGCPIWLSALLGTVIVAGFGFLSGNAVSAQRAVVMYGMMMGAQFGGRTYDLPSVLSLAGLLVLLRQPYAIFQASMQLSFGAVGAFILFPRGLAEMLGKGRVRGDLPEREMKEPGFFGAVKMCYRHLIVRLRKKAKSIPAGIGEGLFLSAKIQLVTAPLQAYHFYYLTPFSGLLNLLVIPGVSVLFVCGMSAALCGCLAGVLPPAFEGIFWQAGCILIKPCGLLLSGYEWLCMVGERLTGGMSVCGRPQTHMLFVYAALLILVAALPGIRSKLSGAMPAFPDVMAGLSGGTTSISGCCANIRDKCRRLTGRTAKKGLFLQLIFMLLLALSMGSLLHAPPVREMQMTMLDVGQGDGVVLEIPGDICVLSDGGSSDVSGVGTYRILPYLLSRGVDTLDLVLVSHWDADHISGIEELIEQNGQELTVKTMLLPDAAVKDEKYKELVQQAETAGISVRTIAAGGCFTCQAGKETVRFDCLSPDPAHVASDRNGYSAVYRVSYGKNRLLLTGDLPDEEERLLMEAQTGSLTSEGVQKGAAAEASHQAPEAGQQESDAETSADGLAAQVLKVAHHGSKYSTSADFLEKVRAKVALISCGKNTSYGHPHAELLARLKAAGCRIFITAQDGAISLQLDSLGTCSVKLGSQQPFAQMFRGIMETQSAG